MAVNHYENFPVGSLALPRRLRKPVHAVYAFARYADDWADEGSYSTAERAAALDRLSEELNDIRRRQMPQSELMRRLYRDAVEPFGLPVEPFEDLLSAFRQDLYKTRYADFGELVDYCRRSANPVGRILLHLYGEHDRRSIAQSDGICTALQLINFWQDVAVDYRKGRIYLPQDDMEKFGVREDDLAAGNVTPAFQRLMAYECHRAHNMLKAGSPLGKTLRGRIGFELRLIILGGQTILHKLDKIQYRVFTQRPVLTLRDKWMMFKRAWQKK